MDKQMKCEHTIEILHTTLAKLEQKYNIPKEVVSEKIKETFEEFYKPKKEQSK